MTRHLKMLIILQVFSHKRFIVSLPFAKELIHCIVLYIKAVEVALLVV